MASHCGFPIPHVYCLFPYPLGNARPSPLPVFLNWILCPDLQMFLYILNTSLLLDILLYLQTQKNLFKIRIKAVSEHLCMFFTLAEKNILNL